MGKTTGDGCVSVEAVYCVGLCITGKVVVVDSAPLAGLCCKITKLLKNFEPPRATGDGAPMDPKLDSTK